MREGLLGVCVCGGWLSVRISRTKKMLSVQTGQQMSIDSIPLWPVSLTWGVPPELTKGTQVPFPCAPSPSAFSTALPPLGLGGVGRVDDEGPPEIDILGFGRWDTGIFLFFHALSFLFENRFSAVHFQRIFIYGRRSYPSRRIRADF